MTITVPVNTLRQVELVTLRTPPISGGVVRDTAKVLVSPLIDLFKGNAFKGEKNFLNWCKNIIVVSRLV